MANNIFTSRGGFMIHIFSSSIGLITHDIINECLYLHKTTSKSMTCYLIESHGKPSHLRLMSHAYESLRENFGSCCLKGQEVCSVNFSGLKLIKETCYLTCFLQLLEFWWVNVWWVTSVSLSYHIALKMIKLLITLFLKLNIHHITNT